MKQEEWRFTSVAPIADTPFTRPHASPAAWTALASRPLTAAVEALGLGAGPRVVFVDGRYAPDLSSVAALPQGVQAGRLAAAIADGAAGELAREHLGHKVQWRDSAFTALNTAFLADGAFVHVPAGAALPAPLEVLYLASGRAAPDGPTVNHPRSLILLDAGAEAVVMETYAALVDAVYWTNAVTEVAVGDGPRAQPYPCRRTDGP